MVETDGKNVSIKMGIIVFVSLISGLILFKFSHNTAEKKNG